MENRLIVQKFGGTSVGSVERIQAVAEKIIATKERGNQIVVVVSAMSGETNRLQSLANEVDCVPNARELDVLLSAGEQVSASLLAMTLHKLGHKATSLAGWQAGIMTDDRHNQATIQSVDNSKLNALLADDQIVIVAGFQGINQHGDVTTLGRGGSDTSAVTLAGLLAADECQIFTDVDGIYSCDPRVVDSAIKLDQIGFDDMRAMASNGAKVLHLPCVEFAAKHNLDIRVLSSFLPEPDSFQQGTFQQGTLVNQSSNKRAVCGLALQRSLHCINFIAAKAELVIAQSQLLGIDVYWQEPSSIVVNDNDRCKLLQALNDEISSIHPISALTVVGAELDELFSTVQAQLLAEDIKVLDSFRCDRVVKLLLLPEHLDLAANFIHAHYIEQSHCANKDKKALIL
ncbi:aspartate kinase [Vibrio sp. UCD-FRSSP16_10]|uniref:aspartate kinase n=1 Tax=unclassified Vibrio TaxID=2614977 RepID=UPI000800DAAD|nr:MULTISPECIES: aspartate kinase [unclassified Vibrio]OBT17469.1 aspartate kinase [Vibrio sp. UCD-FRSSP16_30]OBT23238.1 aspartate kinase [Vibrio sp. UCD-FRSSP16_10]